MATDLRSLRSERVRSDAYALAQSRTRLDRVLREQQEATAILVAAQRAMDDLARFASQQRDLTNTLAARLEDSRADLLQLCIATLPEDVLRCIFEAFVCDGEAAAPFALAAVCARWRRVALQCPAVWSIIHVSARLDALKPQYARVKQLSSRSGSAPLLIEVTGRPPSSSVERCKNRQISEISMRCTRTPRGALEICVILVQPLFQSCHFGVPKGANASSLLILHSSASPYYAPRRPFGRRLFPVRPTSAGATNIRRRTGMLVFCGVSAPINPPFFGLGSQITARISFASLRVPSLSLCLGLSRSCVPVSSLILAPALTNLTLPPSASHDMEPFLDAVSTTVQVLTVHAPVTPNKVVILEHLRNLEEITFFRRGFTKAALQLLAEGYPPIWPRLTTVNSWPPDEEHRWPVEAILWFISSRNVSAPPDQRSLGSGTLRATKLRKVTFAGEPPPWVVAEVERLLEL